MPGPRLCRRRGTWREGTMGRNERTGGRILVDQLRLHGVDLVFGVPGESYLTALDALYDVPELLHRAFMTATSGRPGPVVLSLPEDMLTDRAGVPDAKPWRRVEAAPAPEALAELHRLLQGAQRPFVILGGGGWDAAAAADLA